MVYVEAMLGRGIEVQDSSIREADAAEWRVVVDGLVVVVNTQ